MEPDPDAPQPGPLEVLWLVAVILFVIVVLVHG